MARYYYNQIITLKREIIVDDEIKNFIFENINYRRKVYNDFVEEYWSTFLNPLTGKNERVYKNPSDFKPKEFRKKYFRDIEVPNKIYETYCSGISEQVANDMERGIEVMWSKKTIFQSNFRFRRFDKYRGSFMVRTKPHQREKKIKLDEGLPIIYKSLQSNVYIESDNMVSYSIGFSHDVRKDTNIKLTSRKYKSRKFFQTKEKIFNDVIYIDNNNHVSKVPIYVIKFKNSEYNFREEDIRSIGFKHEFGHFYILLCINGKYAVDKNEKEILKNSDICGIDLGIHNPITLYSVDDNGNDIYKVYRFNDKTLKRLSYLERRSRRLQSIMDRKLSINRLSHRSNKTLSINNEYYSKSYWRVHKKFRITENKIMNIKLDWRRKTCNEITKKYKVICLDLMSIPDNKTHEKNGISKNLQRKFNRSNRLHSMSYVPQCLYTDINKYGCILFESPRYSTCTCSNIHCMHKNKTLPLSNRIFKCAECGFTIDRDYNSARNCYIHAIKKLNTFYN